jgi:electron transfer flavoprotein alpha subunit
MEVLVRKRWKKGEMRMHTAKQVMVFIERDGDALHPLTPEVLLAGKQVAQSLHGELAAVIMGSGITDVALAVRHYGVDTVYVVDHPLLDTYQGEYFCLALSELCRTVQPRIILMANTLTGIDLAPRVAWQLDAGLVTDCVAIDAAGGDLTFSKPIYSGNVMAEYAPVTTPCLVTVRPRAIDPQPRTDMPQGEIIPVTVTLDQALIKTTLVERIEERGDGIRLETADRVVAGGRGIGGSEGFMLLKTMAETLGAAIGASRPPCDLGWVSPQAQVGQTGEIVTPDLYIAVGISGSTQHLAGMAGAKTIVAINKDPQANIFKIADYGVVGNYEDVLPVLTETLQGILT